MLLNVSKLKSQTASITDESVNSVKNNHILKLKDRFRYCRGPVGEVKNFSTSHVTSDMISNV